MGDLNVNLISSRKQLNDFTKKLLQNVEVLDKMIKNDWFDKGEGKIGAEQEICLVDKFYKPASRNLEILEKLDNELFTSELAKFNIEANLPPLIFKGNCFSELERSIDDLLNELAKVCAVSDIDYAITGILPTLRKFDLDLDNLTPLQRYFALMKAISKMRGESHELNIKGIDELNIKHDSPMLEACNTSFQVHYQVNPENFVDKYNIAQVLAAPTVGIASNSPLLFGKRLWNETRIAIFQQSIDTRITSEHLRYQSPRVTFGNAWLENSVIALFREDIARFRVMLMTDSDEDVMKLFKKGVTPKLSALTIHNSTVYRWNRPCYGISDNGKPHLRIENRILPAGPTVVDEVANSAFWLGAMAVFDDHYPKVCKLMDFDDVNANFMSSCYSGLNTKLKWFGKRISMTELIKKELIPIAREGLEKQNVDKKDIDKYLSIIEERNESRQNGTSWMLDSFQILSKDTVKEEVSIAITAAMIKNQHTRKPVHTWKLANIKDIPLAHTNALLVEEFMTTDIFTVRKEDIPELVADIMDWKKIRYMPVEDAKGKLTGLISSRILLRHFAHQKKLDLKESKTVNELMVKRPFTISPDATIFDAMNILREKKIGCLPVVKNNKLVGVVTEGNFLNITASLLKIINKTKSS